MLNFLRVIVILMCATFMALSVDSILHDRGNVSIHVVNIFVQTLLGIFNAYYIFAGSNKLPFSLRLKLANTVIEQVKAGEWKPEENRFQTQVYNLMRNGQNMWIANGAWFLNVDGEDLFGDILKHYVWHKAVKQAAKDANKKYDKPTATIAANKVLGEKPTLTIVK
jgi:hypothetical protein